MKFGNFGLTLFLAASTSATTAFANPFAATSLSPASQSCEVGAPCRVDVVFAVPAGGHVAYGISGRITFDPTRLQIASTTATSSFFPIAGQNVVDNVAGFFQFSSTGSNVSGATFTVASAVFTPITAGTTNLKLHLVNEYIVGYGPYGVDGLAVGGSIDVQPPIDPLNFSDGLIGPASPGLSIPADKYAYTRGGLTRVQSSHDESIGFYDRPMVKTVSGAFLSQNFTSELTVESFAFGKEIIYFGFGEGSPDARYYNEPKRSFQFRIHNFDGGYFGIHAAVQENAHFTYLQDIGTFAYGQKMTFQIVRNGDSLTLSIPSQPGSSRTISISQYLPYLNNDNAYLYFGNTEVNTTFSNFSVRSTPIPQVTYSWSTGEWSGCISKAQQKGVTSTCGPDSGFQKRSVQCIGSDGSIATELSCDSTTRPESIKACEYRICENWTWLTGEWGACNAPATAPAACGPGAGTQTRDLTCIDTISGRIDAGEKYCNMTGQPRPETSQACDLAACDTDGDGVPDTGDSCPATAPGARVNASGCSGAQNISNACPTTGTYKNHGAYVSCVAKAGDQAVLAGLITQAEKDAIQSAAAKSSIGKK